MKIVLLEMRMRSIPAMDAPRVKISLLHIPDIDTKINVNELT